MRGKLGKKQFRSKVRMGNLVKDERCKRGTRQRKTIASSCLAGRGDIRDRKNEPPTAKGKGSIREWETRRERIRTGFKGTKGYSK